MKYFNLYVKGKSILIPETEINVVRRNFKLSRNIAEDYNSCRKYKKIDYTLSINGYLYFW